MNRILISTFIVLGVGAALLGFLQMMSETTKVVAPDSFKPPLENIQEVKRGEYLPAELGDLRMNMPLSEFLTTVHGKRGVHEDRGFRETVTTSYTDNEFLSVTFYFDSKGDKPLYEFIIQYPKEFNLADYVSDRYGMPTHEGEWRFRDNDDYYIMIWTAPYANRLIIAANIDGTEYQHRR